MTDLSQVQLERSRRVKVGALDLEMLLVEWLNELLFLHESQGELYNQFDILELESGMVVGDVWGQAGQTTGASIKAATYHDLTVRQEKGIWQATIVFDV